MIFRAESALLIGLGANMKSRHCRDWRPKYLKYQVQVSSSSTNNDFLITSINIQADWKFWRVIFVSQQVVNTGREKNFQARSVWDRKLMSRKRIITLGSSYLFSVIVAADLMKTSSSGFRASVVVVIVVDDVVVVIVVVDVNRTVVVP